MLEKYINSENFKKSIQKIKDCYSECLKNFSNIWGQLYED